MSRNANSTGAAKSDMKAPNLAPGGYPARVVGLTFIGVQEQRPYKGEAKKPADMLRITYELSTEFMHDEEGAILEDKPRWLTEEIPVYGLNADRAKSTKRYLALDPAQACEGEWKKLIGLPCQVVVVNNESKGKLYDNVGDVTPSVNIPGYEQPELVNPSYYFDPQDEECTVEEFRALPEFVQTKIREANDYAGSYIAKELGDAGVEKEQPKEDNAQW